MPPAYAAASAALSHSDSVRPAVASSLAPSGRLGDSAGDSIKPPEFANAEEVFSRGCCAIHVGHHVTAQSGFDRGFRQGRKPREVGSELKERAETSHLLS